MKGQEQQSHRNAIDEQTRLQTQEAALESIRLEASAAQNQTKNVIAKAGNLESTLQTKIAEISKLKTELEESQSLNSKIWAEMSALKLERTKMSDSYTALASDLDTLTLKLQNSEKTEQSL